MSDPTPFEIVEDEHGKHASDGVRTVTLLDADGRMFRRRAMKFGGSGESKKFEWLVIELHGVRVYQCEHGVVVTTRDLQP